MYTILTDTLPYSAQSCTAEISLEQLNAAVLIEQSVLAVRSFEYDNCVVFALITAPIYLKSERDNLRDKITENISTICPYDVVVTFDNQVYRSIKPNISQDEKAELSMLAKAR